MTVAFTRTRNQIADMVLRKLGVEASGQTPASADTDVIYEAIDLRLKEMHRLGIFWRKVTNVPVSFSLTASIATASAGAGDVLFPIKMTYSNGSLDDPIDLIGYREYAALQDKTRSGIPEKAMWKGGSEFIFYPVPGANGTAKLLYEKIADDTSASSAIDVDVAMIRWVKDLVAYDVADDFGVGEAKVQRFMKEAMIAERNIKKLGQPHVDYETVQVDNFDDRRPYDRRTTDY
jgi:hypothetical protein